MKNKKLLVSILSACLVVVIAIVLIIIYNNKDKKEKNSKELIKGFLKEMYENCEDDEIIEDIAGTMKSCSDTISDGRADLSLEGYIATENGIHIYVMKVSSKKEELTVDQGQVIFRDDIKTDKSGNTYVDGPSYDIRCSIKNSDLVFQDHETFTVKKDIYIVNVYVVREGAETTEVNLSLGYDNENFFEIEKMESCDYLSIQMEAGIIYITPFSLYSTETDEFGDIEIKYVDGKVKSIDTEAGNKSNISFDTGETIYGYSNGDLYRIYDIESITVSGKKYVLDETKGIYYEES